MSCQYLFRIRFVFQRIYFFCNLLICLTKLLLKIKYFCLHLCLLLFRNFFNMLKKNVAYLAGLFFVFYCFCEVRGNIRDTIFDSSLNFTLLDSIYQKDTVAIKEILSANADPNARDYAGVTALMYAVMSEKKLVIDLLIQSGADINAKDYGGTNVLMYAILTDNDEVISVFINHIDSVNHQNNSGQSALMFAAQTGNLNVIQRLMYKGAEVEMHDHNRMTALMYATAFGQFYAVDMLLYYGAEVNNAARDGSTSLHLAGWYGHNEVAGLLIDSGANIEAADNAGNTPLMVSVLGINLQTAWYFIESGSALDATNYNDHTPLALAAGLNDLDMVNLITSYDYDEPITGKKQNTALALAYANKNNQMASRIINFQGYNPRGLYLSDIITDAGLNFNKGDLMYGFAIGLIESRYRVLAKISWHKRFNPLTAYMAQSDNLIYRYLEDRTIWTFSFQRDFRFFNFRGHEFGGLAGIGLLYSFGKYNGTEAKPPIRLSAAPAMDVYYRYKWFSLFGSYNFFQTGVSDIPANRYQVGIRVYIPLYRPGSFGYVPVIR
jgi:ankyrin repeat protein